MQQLAKTQPAPAVSGYMVASGSRNGLPPTKSFGTEILEGLFPEGASSNPLLNPVNSTNRAIECFRIIWNKALFDDQEQVYVLYVNRQLEIIEWKCLFTGGESECSVDINIIMRYAISLKAGGLFIAHNHPGGTLKPSDYDIELTDSVKSVSHILGIRLLDHVILAKKGHFSFHEDCRL